MDEYDDRFKIDGVLPVAGDPIDLRDLYPKVTWPWPDNSRLAPSHFIFTKPRGGDKFHLVLNGRTMVIGGSAFKSICGALINENEPRIDRATQNEICPYCFAAYEDSFKPPHSPR